MSRCSENSGDCMCRPAARVELITPPGTVPRQETLSRQQLVNRRVFS